MKLFSIVASTLAVLSASDAFAPHATREISSSRMNGRGHTLAMTTDDCGCDQVIMSGKPADKARALNAREVIGKFSVVDAQGQQVAMNDLVGKESSDDVSVVVFLRSLG